MNISKISVKGLFGEFDYEIPINSSDHVAVITGPNGYGKTTIISLLNRISCMDVVELALIEFRDYEVEFVDGSKVCVNRRPVQMASGDELVKKRRFATKASLANQRDNESADKKVLAVTISCFINGDEKQIICKFDTFNDFCFSLADRRLARLVGLSEFGHNRFYNDSTGEVVTRDRIIKNYHKEIVQEYRDLYDSEYFNSLPNYDLIASVIKEKLHCLSIDTYRLQKLPVQNEQSEIHTPKTNVLRYRSEDKEFKLSVYSSLICKIMNDAYDEYNEKSRELDEKFPEKLIAAVESSRKVSKLTLDGKWKELKLLRDLVKETGMLKSSAKIVRLNNTKNEPAKKVLHLYYENEIAKIKQVESVLDKISFFLSIINTRLENKKITIDREEGFIVEKDNKKTIPITMLSSGEQHELVLFYNLLFQADAGTTILIDEPEISWHVAWQLNFISDLKQIAEYNGCSFLVATHSPSIINGEWDIVSDLADCRG